MTQYRNSQEENDAYTGEIIAGVFEMLFGAQFNFTFFISIDSPLHLRRDALLNNGVLINSSLTEGVINVNDGNVTNSRSLSRNTLNIEENDRTSSNDVNNEQMQSSTSGNVNDRLNSELEHSTSGNVNDRLNSSYINNEQEQNSTTGNVNDRLNSGFVNNDQHGTRGGVHRRHSGRSVLNDVVSMPTLYNRNDYIPIFMARSLNRAVNNTPSDLNNTFDQQQPHFLDYIQDIFNSIQKKQHIKKELMKNKPYVYKKQSGKPKECLICLNNFKYRERIRKLDCEHEFHKKCIDKWLVEGNACCPLCRKEPFIDKKADKL